MDFIKPLTQAYNSYNNAVSAGYLRGPPKRFRVPGNRKFKTLKYGARRVPRSIGLHYYKRRSSPISIKLDPTLGFAAVTAPSGGGTPTLPSYGMSLAFAADAVLMSTGNATYSLPVTFSDIQSLYDVYRISKVTVQLFYSINDVYNANNNLPLLQVCTDYDDNTAPTSNTIIPQYGNMQLMQLGSGRVSQRTIYPRVTETLTVPAGSSGTAGTSSRSGPWISVSTPDVPHLGMKLFWDCPYIAGVSSTIGFIQMYVVYHYMTKVSK